jgi:predicted nucleic acid-binding protein
MAIDPSQFHLVNVSDTCAVWNVLSSVRLYGAAKEAHCEFCITSFVRYECLVKRRKAPTVAEIDLMERLEKEQARGAFAAHSCSISDLQAVELLESRKRLGKGELSSIAFAMKIGHAIITDDKKARKLAETSGHALTQTTPHLFAWLIFKGYLGDGDRATVIEQHQAMERPLAPHFDAAYSMALQCRLNATRT